MEKTNTTQQNNHHCLSFSSHTPQLPETVELAVGMKVLVTYNIETNLDITNGMSGTIVDVVLDSKETAWQNQQICHLQYPPRYILVRLDRTNTEKLPGLDNHVIPIEMITKLMGSFQ